MRLTAAIFLFIFAAINGLTAMGYLVLGGTAAVVGDALEDVADKGDQERADKAAGRPVLNKERPTEYADDEWGELNRDLDDLSEWAEEVQIASDQAEDDALREEGMSEEEVAEHALAREAKRDSEQAESDAAWKESGGKAKDAGSEWMLMALFLLVTAILQVIAGVSLLRTRHAIFVYGVAAVTVTSEVAGILVWDNVGIFNGLGLVVAVFAVVGASMVRVEAETYELEPLR